MGQMGCQPSFDADKFGISSQILVFVGVRSMVVEFFTSVSVSNVAIVEAAGGVVVVVPGGDRWFDTTG